jgi:hypothetical protein
MPTRRNGIPSVFAVVCNPNQRNRSNVQQYATSTSTLAFLPQDASGIARTRKHFVDRRFWLRRMPAILFAVVLGFTADPALAQELIANKDLSGSELSRTEARLFFTMRLRNWSNDRPVKVFVLPDDDPLHSKFTKTILGLFPYQLRRVWDRQLFTGTGQVPVTVANEQEMLQRVASTPGAIGYLANSPGDDRVQVIKVR